jgi:excisionase family DNA binding protein
MSRIIADLAPSDLDPRIAQSASRTLEKMVQSDADSQGGIHLHADDADTVLILPLAVIRMLLSLLREIEKGNGVSLILNQVDLSTQQAADMLNVSQTYFIRLLEEGKIPFHTVGAHRRVKFQDIVHYMKDSKEAALPDLAEMAALNQEMDLY